LVVLDARARRLAWDGTRWDETNGGDVWRCEASRSL